MARSNNCVRSPSCQKVTGLKQSVNLSEPEKEVLRSKDRNACQRAVRECAENMRAQMCLTSGNSLPKIEHPVFNPTLDSASCLVHAPVAWCVDALLLRYYVFHTLTRRFSVVFPSFFVDPEILCCVDVICFYFWSILGCFVALLSVLWWGWLQKQHKLFMPSGTNGDGQVAYHVAAERVR